jgi:hypothetical protein
VEVRMPLTDRSRKSEVLYLSKLRGSETIPSAAKKTEKTKECSAEHTGKGNSQQEVRSLQWSC